MRGHEYPRRLLAAMLADQVPRRLAVLRAEMDDTWPPDPAAVLLSDRLPDDESLYPCILVTSTRMTSMKATSATATVDGFVCTYELTIAVAVRAARHGGDEAASIGRDRVLLAVREALLTAGQLANDCQAVVRGLGEQTGQAGEDMQARPLSLGNLTLSALVYETVTDPSGPGADHVVTGHQETLHAAPADTQTLIPPPQPT